jgi:hypothetical protein
MFTELIAGTKELAAGYHCVCAGCAELQAQGQVAPGAQTAAVSTAARIDESAALIAGSHWSSGPGERTVITYSFSKPGSRFDAAEAAFSSSASEFSGANKQTTRAVLDSIEAVCNVQFVEVADGGAAPGVLRYGYSQRPNEMGFAGYAFFPSASEAGGNIWIGKDQAAGMWDYYRPNLILHETLHAIGLKHPFDGQAVLASQTNIIPNTVMSYSTIAGSQSGALSQYPAEPMGLDIKALQDLYGVARHAEGNSRYDVSDAGFQCFRALWDSSGVDTLDASRCAQGVRLDLAAGARSDVGAQVKAFAYFGTGAGRTSQELTYTATLSIAPGVSIENATGSAFGDVLLGNALANILSGGDGDDLLEGRGGNDTLLGGNGKDLFRLGTGVATVSGGEGEDTAVFAGSSRDYVVSKSADHYTVSSLREPGSVATLQGVEKIEFSDLSLAAGQSQAAIVRTDAFSAQAFRLYKAALNRLPDQEGLACQARVLEQGVPLSQLAGNFMASAEFQQRFGTPDHQGFVSLLYHNVLGRAPDQTGLAYHTTLLEQQTLTRADVLAAFSESPENQAAVGVGLVGVLYPMM